jgi:hypothetical protein
MGLTLDFGMTPGPRRPHHAHHRLTAGMNVDMLNRHLLLALTTVAVERLKQHGEGAG